MKQSTELPLIAKHKLGLVKVNMVPVGLRIIEDFVNIMKTNGLEYTATVNIALERYLKEIGLLKT